VGREIKRVPANFDWPLGQTWKGYLNPYRAFPCKTCVPEGSYGGAFGDGRSPEAREIADSFYDLANHRGGPNGRSKKAWADKLTQEEVNLLVDEGRLYDFVNPVVQLDKPDEDGRTWTRKRVMNEDGTPFYPTAEEVNEWERGPGMGHDGINRCILIEHRLKEAGLVDGKELCHVCKGEGCIWFSEKIKRQAANFCGESEDYDDLGGDPEIGEIWTEPPTGEWWQVWETVSEGSPVSPAFATGEELVEYLVEGGDAWTRSRQAKNEATWDKPPSREAAMRFVFGAGWTPTMMSNGKGELKHGVHTCEPNP
jgi:hypothetical protein